MNLMLKSPTATKKRKYNSIMHVYLNETLYYDVHVHFTYNPVKTEIGSDVNMKYETYHSSHQLEP